jgi:LytS/YehU family sensor histidine kinase
VSTGTILVELAEKMGLLAAAALLAVLLPPLRNRVLGVGRRVDKAAGMLLGMALAIWGALLGLTIEGEHINVRAIGVMLAGILGGRKAGVATGLVAGLFSATRGDADAAPFVVVASVIDGLLAGVLARRRPEIFQGWRAFPTCIAIQTVHLAVVGVALFALGHASRYVPAWPAHVIKLVVDAAGVTLFVVVARLVVAREEAAVALVAANAAADAAALESLRRRLEPHFLFNALNALRSLIRTDPARARELVSDLSDLYRYLLSHPHEATVREEVQHAVAYLAIERARLGPERLSVRVEIAPDVAQAAVPALLLQPLVENAVKHGVAAHDGPGTVTVRARREGEALVLEVEDRSEGARVGGPGGGGPEGGGPRVEDPRVEGGGPERAGGDGDRPGAGIALATLRERLGKQHGARAELELLVSSAGAVARVALPAPASPSSELGNETGAATRAGAATGARAAAAAGATAGRAVGPAPAPAEAGAAIARPEEVG